MGYKGQWNPHPAAVLEREHQVWTLRCQGKTYVRIAEETGLSVSGVETICKRVGRKYHDEMVSGLDAMKAHQTELLLHIMDEAVQAWERSKAASLEARTELEDGTSVHRPQEGPQEARGEAIGGPDDKSTVESRKRHSEAYKRFGKMVKKHTTTERSRDGEAAYLRVAMDALAEIRKIWGMDAPKPVEIGGSIGAVLDSEALAKAIARVYTPAPIDITPPSLEGPPDGNS